MTFSRSHAGMIGIISLFTGMIAPIGVAGHGYPFPLTNIQGISYIFLILLAITFYLISVKNWKFFRFVGSGLLILLICMVFMMLTGSIRTIDTNTTIHTISWGWIFLGVGSIAIIYCIFDKTKEDLSEFSIFSDMIIGIVGSITLIGLTSLIATVSLDKSTKTPDQGEILHRYFQSGGLTDLSGITMSPAYKNIDGFVFERKNDLLRFYVHTESGSMLFPENTIYNSSSIKIVSFSKDTYILGESNYWNNSGMHGYSGYTLVGSNIALEKEGSIEIITEAKQKTYTGNIDIKSIAASENNNIFAWVESSSTGKILIKDGEKISDAYKNISHIHLSKSGYDSTALAETLSGSLVVLRNGAPTETIRTGYLDNSWKSNGIHTLYITKEDDIYRVIYDGVSIGKEFSEIRETFLEKNGNGYAYFGKKRGEPKYCLETRYKGSLCGLDGYMNPILGADGSSIIYAGYKDNIWGIYRNTSSIVRDAGYNSTDISGDYAFYDATNPKQYVFIQKIGEEKYQIRKNGKVIPYVWKDVGLDVAFGYDNKVIMPLQDNEGWRIAEF